ncbi:aldo/keto reductase [Sphaerisporangium sp. NPDC049002]|uniref:aldo/keto reductase n=1 Tax=Sphaerisporangium sp. NPDC049002 TaxID=3155392 RepID=UPI0033EEFBF2
MTWSPLQNLGYEPPPATDGPNGPARARTRDDQQGSTTMRYRVLGGTGIEVSAHCLGTMMFGSAGNPDHQECARIVHAALDQGINFVDTADMY